MSVNKLGAQIDGNLLKYVIKFHHLTQVLPSTDNVYNHSGRLASTSLPIMSTLSLSSSGAANKLSTENGKRQKEKLYVKMLPGGHRLFESLC
jgi:hypothetical protein